jgi:hypothetical protein
MIVGAADFILFGMCKLKFNYVRMQPRSFNMLKPLSVSRVRTSLLHTIPDVAVPR